MSDDGLRIFADERQVAEDTSRRLLPVAVAALVVIVGAGLFALFVVVANVIPFLAAHAMPSP